MIFTPPDGVGKSVIAGGHIWQSPTPRTKTGFWDSVNLHRTMLGADEPDARPRVPSCYVRIQAPKPTIRSASDALTLDLASEHYYTLVKEQLSSLSDGVVVDGDMVEKGAVESALVVLEQLHAQAIAPPEITWHGGDAIVMLWVLGGTTYAITITEGEFGYVIRRDKRRIRKSEIYKISEASVLGIGNGY